MSLIGDSPISTKSFGITQSLAGKGPDSTMSNAVNAAGSDVFPQGTVLRLEIDGAEPILIKPKIETVFGRRDPATGSMPDVDLTPFAGYRMGVSRKHALIRQNETGDKLELWDLGSSNGTFLNSTKLDPNKPYRLHDGDEVRFGQMMMRLYFQDMPSNGTADADKAPKDNSNIIT
jgi:pSer/pThr/pTyr-binding forkhead associated (FHA) protein